MIFANFLYFIIAIIIFSTAPASGNRFSPFPQDLFWILVVFAFFFQFNRHCFKRLRHNLDDETIDLNRARRDYFALINVNTIISIFLFALEIFIFNLKHLLLNIPLFGELETLANAGGLGLFLLHLFVVWYWAYRSMGDVFQTAESAQDYLKSNLKFNLIIVIPWLALSLVMDTLSLLHFPLSGQIYDSAIFQVVFFALFLFLLAIFAPVLITRLWDCRPLQDRELLESISSFCRSQKVKFRGILSWDALNSSLITAGVVGLFAPFRYLLITPRLMNILDKDEILAVVSHEVGHVRKRHMFYYMLFFVGFIILSIGALDRLIKLFLNTRFGFEMVISSTGEINTTFLSILTILVSLFLFIFYFRFIFGYFMRNFERQADLYCFQSGIDPGHMISSFVKLGSVLGDDEKKSNWHHYNISQRIAFLRECVDNRGKIVRHQRKIRGSLNIFIAALLAFTLLSFNPYAMKLESDLDLSLMIGIVKERIEKNPKNPVLYTYLATFYYESEKWEQAKEAFETSLQLDYRQPEALNNYAWLLLKSPDKRLLDPRKALKLAGDAYKLKEAAHILDTLAEAYYENSMFKDAYTTSGRALALARENHQYYRDQFLKMKKAYLRFKDAISI